MDEQELTERARNGDLASFEALYRAHVGRVLALCRRMTGDAAIAEDLTQEAFVLAWRKFAEFRGDSLFGTWVHRIATNVTLGYLRKAAGWKLLDTLEDTEMELPVAPGPKPDAIDLERAIALLPVGARSVFVLHDIEGLEHHEIARRMGIAEGTSKGQLHRARKILMRRLA